MKEKQTEEKESIEQLIKKARKDLEAYNINTDIHNFEIKEDYRKRFDGCELNFVVSKKLGTKKSSSKKSSDVDDSKIEKFTNFQWAGEGNAYSNRLVSVTNRGDAYVFTVVREINQLANFEKFKNRYRD